MALSPGTRLGPYPILGPLGAGGMGEVYKARDVRLERTVAVKILPPQFSADPDRKQRFDTSLARARYLPTADGQRFLTVAPLGRDAMAPVTLVLNWAADLGR